MNIHPTFQILVNEIYDYMKFREIEYGIGSPLPKDWYRSHIQGGYTNFFGVRIDVDGLVEDTRYPEVFEKYMSKKYPKLKI